MLVETCWTHNAHGAREWIVRGAMLFAAVVQCLPLVGVAGRSALARLYGALPEDTTTELLLRHRAVLLALVGVVIAAGALVPAHRSLALWVGLASKGAFLILWVKSPSLGAAITRVARADMLSALALCSAALLRLR